jgi:hypothetical protein
MIALSGREKVGKTTTIRFAKEKLIEQGCKLLALRMPGKGTPSKETRLIVEFDGVRIGFASKGDDWLELKEQLWWLTYEKCSVIVCATRPRGTVTYMMMEDAARLAIPPFMVERIEKDGTEKDDAKKAIENRAMADKIVNAVWKAVELAKAELQPV